MATADRAAGAATTADCLAGDGRPDPLGGRQCLSDRIGTTQLRGCVQRLLAPRCFVTRGTAQIENAIDAKGTGVHYAG